MKLVRTRGRSLRVAATAAIMAIGLVAAACSPQNPFHREPSVRLVFYTDVYARPRRGVVRVLQAAAVGIGSQRADVIIAGGDMVDAGTAVTTPDATNMWISYRSMLQTIGGNVRHVFGERDLVGPAQALQRGADPRALIHKEFQPGRTYGSFNSNDYHFVLLDSVQPTKDGYRGFVDAEQLDWLASDLERIPTTTPVIAVTHMPLRTTAGDDQVVANAQAVLDVLMRRRLVLVLQGHVRKAEAFQEGGVTFLTGGAVCGTADCRGTEPGFVVAKVRPDRVEWKYVKSGA